MLQRKPTNERTSLKPQQRVNNITKLLHITGLTGPSSVSPQLYKTIVGSSCHLQYLELPYAHQCMNYIEMHMCIENCKIFIIYVWPACLDDRCLVTLLTFVWSCTSLWLISQLYWWIKVFLVTTLFWNTPNCLFSKWNLQYKTSLHF